MKIALVQQKASENRDLNRRRGIEAVEAAARQGARIVCFAELAFDPFYPQDKAGPNRLDKAEPVPGQISALFQHIRPAVRAAQGDPAAAIRENVRIQALTLLEASPVIASLVSSGRLLVAGGIFDLRSGRVEPVEVG